MHQRLAYPLDEVLLLLLAAALAGAETVADIARFGRAKLSFLQRFRLYKNGTPSHDQLGIILAKLDPVAFQRCFVAWTAALTKTSAEVIAIDGKTVRRSYQKKGAEEPIHGVSAFATRQRMVLGQVKVGEKSNEIVAIPALLDLLAIEGAVMTIDAMGCQRDIAQKIIDKKADYILALKGNQGTLRDDVEMFAREQKAVAFANTSVSRDATVDGDHGRIETRTVTVLHDIGWLQDNHQWPGLKSVVRVESQVMTVDLIGTFHVTRLSIPHLKKSAAGSIVVMSSLGGRFGYPNRSAYCTAKMGLIGFAKTLSRELGKYNIRANAIAPGAVGGDRIERVLQGRAGADHKTLAEERDAAMSLQSLKRFVDPKDIAALILFLTSDAGKSISGQVLPIDNDAQTSA